MVDNENRLLAMLSDLGRSTLRGIRKCPNCGIYNGTRGINCKNKECGFSFSKEGQGKTKTSIEQVCKLDTGSSTQVFSVRVREKGPESRGFVQIPVSAAGTSSDALLPQVSALCFIDSCQRLFQSNILKCHDKTEPVGTCSHVEAALRCKAWAQPLAINETILSAMDAPPSIIQEVLRMCSEGGAAVVQRVSKNMFAVRCPQTTKHLPGFVHISFSPTKSSDSFSCYCMPRCWKSGDSMERKCIHYYACLAAFCSDLKLTDSQQLMECVLPHLTPTVEVVGEMLAGRVESGSAEDQEQPGDLQNSVLDHTDTSTQFLDKTELLLDDISLLKELDGDVTAELKGDSSVLTFSTLLSQPTTTTTTSNNHNNNNNIKVIKKRKREPKTNSRKRDMKRSSPKHSFLLSDECADPNTANQPFKHWLASVTERINQAMHFQFDGKPQPLVFHIPHVFFDCLMKRFMLLGSRRRKLPNLVTRFTRRQSPPLGTFFNYTWHVTNILHAKAIFDTPLMHLNVTRSFIVNSDGSYDDFEPSVCEDNSQVNVHPSIRPTELKTYLKIGRTAADQVSPSALSIDWTPNVLPVSKIGELKITFEYGHSPNIS